MAHFQKPPSGGFFFRRGGAVDWSSIEGDWQRYKASAHVRWAEIRLEELDLIAGRRERLTGQIHAVYGVSRAEAEAQVRRWLEEQASAAALGAANS
jgi:uncharacterized protein YjbJ (UPF0337 family)